MVESEDFLPGRLIGSGAHCEVCGSYLGPGEWVYTLANETGDIDEYLYCTGCRPPDDDLPPGVICLEPALAVEELGLDERVLGIEVRAGSMCRVCDHTFYVGEWLFVGVVEGLYSGAVVCLKCFEALVEEEPQE
jgi:hypothetical protein